ncbi:hypothetical protein LCGC14_2158460 [marine sediment metagenome]|uniref:Uncharacterized protein n=1 Tax=marine sediment metagenome TaxID=412755 RepID=A0A0F9DTC2_9ZZZZ
MKNHGIPAACVIIVATICLTTIQLVALHYGINGTMRLMTVTAIAGLSSGFAGFSMRDVFHEWWKGR